MNTHRMLMIVLIAAVCVLSAGIGTAEDVNLTFEGHFWGSIYATVVSGNYASVGQGQDLVVLDISNPSEPLELGRIDTLGFVEDIKISGSYAYVANWNNGLMILHTDASGTDATPLTLTITSPTDGTTVSTSTISVTGTATDATGNSTTEIVTITASLPNLVFAITPNSRLAQVGTPVTIFMSVINAGTGSATDVSILQASGLPATTSYQAWNSVTLIGTPDTPVDIGSGETVDFVLTINPTTEFVSSAMTFDVSGTNSGSAPVSGVNTLMMAASATPYADVIMMSTSLDLSTAVNTPTAFALAATNVGSASATDVSLTVEIPSSITGLSYQVNETNPDGSIKGPATGLTIPVGYLPTFAFFLTPSELISFDPANNRIMLKLVDGNGKLGGAQSVAISTI